MNYDSEFSASELRAWSEVNGILDLEKTDLMKRKLMECLELIVSSGRYEVGEVTRINISPLIQFMIIPVQHRPIEGQLYSAGRPTEPKPYLLESPHRLSHVFIDIDRRVDNDGSFFNFKVCGHIDSNRFSWVTFPFDPREGHDFTVLKATPDTDSRPSGTGYSLGLKVIDNDIKLEIS